MREDWKYLPLGEIVEIKRGLTYSKNDEVDISGKIVLRSNNVNLDNHQFDFTELKYLKPTFDIPADKYLQKGDLLMCMSNGSKAHLGKVALYEGESDKYAFGGFMAALSHNERVIGKYLFYAMITPMYKEYIKRLSDGANINNLKIRDIEAYTIPIPPLSEQQQIVDKLDAEFDKIDLLKTNAEHQLKAAKDLFQSALKELLTPKEGWEEKLLGNICDILDSKRKPITKNKREAGNIPYYGATGILDYVKDYIFNERLVLLGEDGAKWGAGENSAYIIEGKTWVNNHAHALRPHRNIIVDEFLVFFLNYADLQDYITGVTVPKLNQEKMRGITIPIPSLSQQKEIVDKLDSLSEHVKQLQTNYDQTITLCNDLKQALLKSIFA